ncbi:hypothetical protein TRAPUB_13591 [Trametes pubescens]|uniref:Uncharacterized protein n=1 Tax=Trametes pubescens TaxID=154538 RepID=A0A1M2VQN7_TRAPU|nr:hypothetical protein TRAPUB_13591 [Trametes pubescens]
MTAIASHTVCDLPFMGFLPLCAPSGTRPTSIAGRVDFPHLMSIQHRALDEFVGQSLTGSELALDIKHAQLTVQDLVVMVKESNLTIKGPLSDTLAGFVLDAKDTSRGLQRLSSKILGAIDSITSFNTYVMHEIDTTTQKGTRTQLDETLVRMFRASMDNFSSQISRLLVSASIAANSLDRLEERLSTAHALCIQETIATTFAQDDLLWRLWSILGGNKDQRRDLENRSSVLKEVTQYRAVAMAYVFAAMQALTAVDADLTALRERLVASDVSTQDLPLEVHIASIQRGLYRVHDTKIGSRDEQPRLVGEVRRSQVGGSE